MTAPADDAGARISAAMAEILAEIPGRVNIRGIAQDAFNRIARAANQAGVSLPPEAIGGKVAEVLREIATHAVEEFCRRTGEPFHWKDDPPPPADQEPLMSFAVDPKGNVVLGEAAPPPPPAACPKHGGAPGLCGECVAEMLSDAGID